MKFWDLSGYSEKSHIQEGGGGGQGVTISRLPYLFVPLSPDSRPLLCFSRYRVNDAV